MKTVTRFAPSPTGYLHLGHAYSALFAYEAAQRAGGKFLLRIEDIDPVRCKPEFTTAIFEDLHWLGLTWEEPVLHQSQNMPAYAESIQALRKQGVLYPCFCTRSEIANEVAAAASAPHDLSDESTFAASGREALTATSIYPGTCRNLPPDQQAEKLATHKTANWRLDIKKALTLTGPLTWRDEAKGQIEARPQTFGDVVLARKDIPTSYHLSVTTDDHRQGVTYVTRGEDLFRSTDIHRLLQVLLGYEIPAYHHHPLVLDESGRRYAKRDKAATLRELKGQGLFANQIRELIKFPK
jgi:glutamyl-Q tRNA(Asp) synthetase